MNGNRMQRLLSTLIQSTVDSKDTGDEKLTVD